MILFVTNYENNGIPFVNQLTMHQLTDNALMLKVKSGEVDKLGLLYERHKKRLFGFYYNLGNDPMTSEDLVQNVFIRMLKYKKSYTGEGSFMAWMFRMARNVNYDHHKKDMKNRNQTDVTTIAYKLEQEVSPSDSMDKNDTISQLHRAMNSLSVAKREVLVLSKFKEMKFSEIGEVLGCSEGAAKVKAHRALNDLRTAFEQMQIK